MKKSMVILLTVLLLTGVASAQVGLTIGGGVSKVMNENSDWVKMGFNGNVAYMKPLSDKLHLGIRAAYNFFGIDTDKFTEMLGGELGGELAGVELDVTGNFSVIEITPVIHYFLGESLFLHLNGGLYMVKTKADYSVSYMGYEMSESWDDSETKFGVSFGFGFNLGNIQILPIYNIIFTDVENISFISVNLGWGL